MRMLGRGGNVPSVPGLCPRGFPAAYSLGLTDQKFEARVYWGRALVRADISDSNLERVLSESRGIASAWFDMK